MKLSRVSVGQALKAARDQARLTLVDLASLTSMTVSSISRTERGERDLTYAEMVQISHSLKIEVAHFQALAETFERLGVANKKEQINSLADDLVRLQQAALEMVVEAKNLDVLR